MPYFFRDETLPLACVTGRTGAANHPRRFARELAVAPIKHPASEPAGIDFERVTDALEGKWPISLNAKKPPLGIGEQCAARSLPISFPRSKRGW